VAAIALGNEPNWYTQAEDAVALYVKNALDAESQIIKNLSLTADASRVLQVGGIASLPVSADKFNL